METLGTSSTTQICTSCSKEYDAKHITVFERDQDLSGGLCYECRAKKDKERIAREKASLATEVNDKRAMWRNACGIPDKYQQATLEAFSVYRPGNMKSSRDICQKYADGFPIDYLKHKKSHGAYPSLVLFSTDVWGIGKTHLVCAIMHRILDRWNGERTGCPVMFVSEPELYLRIRATYNYTPEEKKRLESEEDIMRGLLYTPLLVLDDVGKVPATDTRFVQRTLFAIINGRYNNLRPILLTSNMGAEHLERYMGNSGDEATFNRLEEMTGGIKRGFVWMKGESYRKLNKEV